MCAPPGTPSVARTMTPLPPRHRHEGRRRGLLAGAAPLAVPLHLAVVLLTVASTVRYLQGHGFGDRAPQVLAAAAALLLGYAGHAWLVENGRAGWSVGSCAVVVLTWVLLVGLAPSFSWCAVPLAFVALQVLPFRVAAAVLTVMVAVVATAWLAMQDVLDPTVVVGPACVAVLTVTAYRALERDAAARQRLLDDLRIAQGELAATQHRAGVLDERARLSREIHDSVAQGLSSINLLLQAADQDWGPRPAAAREHVQQAARTARDGLTEVRGVVRDLAAPALDRDDDGRALLAALREELARTTAGTALQAEVVADGDPVPLPPEVATAVLRTARGALANVVEHADAARVRVTLTYQPGSVSLDVRDDGQGFRAGVVTALAEDRGHGLAGVRARVEALGGRLVVESGPGAGTALAVALPLAPAPGDRRPDRQPTP